MAMSGAALALLLACSTNAPTPAAVLPRATAVPGGSTPARTTAQDEQLAWERRLAENFAAPSEHHSFEQRTVYWILTDTAGVVVRHDTGGRELLFRDERYWRTYLPDDYRRARARADAAGRRGPLGGFFRLGSGQVYQHFPEVREMDLVSYGLMPAAFGADTVMLAFGMVRPASRE